MGLIETTYYDELCSPVPARNPNRIRVYRMPNKEVVIHYRDMKVVLHTEEEIQEWKRAFSEAKDRLGNHFNNDICG
jgi:hypothetical protein